MTEPDFCTRFTVRVYLTAMGCEIGFGTLLNQVGCEERKIPAEGVIFFLTSTIRDMAWVIRSRWSLVR